MSLPDNANAILEHVTVPGYTQGGDLKTAGLPAMKDHFATAIKRAQDYFLGPKANFKTHVRNPDGDVIKCVVKLSSKDSNIAMVKPLTSISNHEIEVPVSCGKTYSGSSKVV
jgi:hypothetical protein